MNVGAQTTGERADIAKSIGIALAAVLVMAGGAFAWVALDPGAENSVRSDCRAAVRAAVGDVSFANEAVSKAGERYIVTGTAGVRAYRCSATRENGDSTDLDLTWVD